MCKLKISMLVRGSLSHGGGQKSSSSRASDSSAAGRIFGGLSTSVAQGSKHRLSVVEFERCESDSHGSSSPGSVHPPEPLNSAK
eukprot:1599224-Prymnesium_polylepis.2